MKTKFEVWARPEHLSHRVRVRVYRPELWQAAHWTAVVLVGMGYRDVAVKEIEFRASKPREGE